MTLTQLIDFYDGRLVDVAKALRVSPQSIAKWRSTGVIPPLRQLQIRDLTRGELRPSRAALRELGL